MTATSAVAATASAQGRLAKMFRKTPGLVLLGLTVMALAFAAVEIPRELGRAAPLWLANGVLLSALLVSSARRWPTLMAVGLAGNLAANLLAGDNLGLALSLPFCNGLEVIFAAILLRRLVGRDLDFSHGRDLTLFCLIAGVAAPMISALPATLALQVFRQGEASNPFGAYLAWATADGLGAMLITPVILTLRRARRHFEDRPLQPAGIASLVALSLVTLMVFTSETPLVFFIPPALLLVVFQMETLGAVTGVLIIAVIALAATATGLGPAAQLLAHSEQRLVVAQLFLAVMLLTSLPTSAVLAQRRRLQTEVTGARDRAEAAAAEAAEQFRRARLVEDIAGVGYFRFDQVTGSATWSDRMYRLLGLEAGVAMDLDAILNCFHPDDRARTTALIKGAIERGEDYEAESRVVLPGGEVRHLFGRTICERGPDGQVQGLVGILIDLSDVKRAQAKAMESQDAFRRLAENASDMITHTDLKGNLVYISPSVETITGFKPEELIGRPILNLLHPDDVAHVQEVTLACLRSRGRAIPTRVQYRGIGKDGQVIWLEARPSPLIDPDTGRVYAFTDVVRDISERKAMEEALRAARAEAEAAAAVKGEFMANMSHELRTPLTSVLGFTRLALEQPDLRAATRGHIVKAARAGEALLTTVNDILDFSKLEAGQVEIRPRPCDAAAVCRETLDLFSQAAAEKGLTLGFSADEAPPSVSLDPDRLRQLLLNLVGNAVKFSERGQVSVAVRWRAADQRLAVDVRDQGPGIAQAQQDLLFKRFSQVDGSSTRRHGGTGLGLAICMGLVEAMGGSIGVESAEGEGARFHFEIAAPLAAPATEPAEADPQAPLPQVVRVLVADDHAVNRELVRAVLEPLGLIVAEAADGAQAVEAARTAAFDLIFMDLRMPVMDGVAAVKAIRAGGGPNARTPIVAFSAGSEALDDKVRRAAGFDAILAKPMLPKELLALTMHLVSRGDDGQDDPADAADAA